MASIKDVVAYILREYPHSQEMANARVTKLIYLADWKHCLEQGKQITNIKWYFDSFGPFVWDVKNEIDENKRLFSTVETRNAFGSKKIVFSLDDKKYTPRLSSTETSSIDHIINISKTMYWKDFIKLVYSTYPITTSERYSFLNLIEKAKEYKSKQ
jgi:hypothetical protein